MSSKLIFFGTENFSAPSLQALIKAGHDVVAVVTKPDSRRGRGRQLAVPIVKTIAEQQGIPVLQPSKLTDIEAELKSLMPASGVLVSYGKIIPQRTLDLFKPVGIINVHPSLLPHYRGPAPIEAAIVNGDELTGISIMRLTAGMDEGPIFSQLVVPLNGHETKPELYDQLAEAGAEELTRRLPDILAGRLQAKPQKNNDVSYTSLIFKQDGILDPSTDTASALERKVRAYQNYPKTRLKIKNIDVIVTSAKTVSAKSDDQLIVRCYGNTYLLVEELVGPSGKRMSGQAFLRGLRD